MGWLVFSNLYVALCGAALTVATYALLGLPPRVDAVAGLVFAATLVVYNLDRLVDPHRDDPTANASPHERWVAEHRVALWCLTGAALVGCILAALGLRPMATLSLVLPALLALGYCLPVLPGRPRWRRLKELPGAKLLLIGVVWTYATAALPMLQAGALPGWGGSGLLVLVLARLLFILAVALPFDLPDMARDRASGITTLPQALGVAGARRVGLLLMLGFMVCAVLHPWPAAAALLVSGAVSWVMIAQMRADRGVWYYEVGLDGLLPVQAALVLAVAYRP